MKRYLLLIVVITLTSLPVVAQLYHSGEVLSYRVSYRAFFFPNTELAEAKVATTDDTLDGVAVYKVDARGYTLPEYRWMFDVDDKYTVHVDQQTLVPLRFQSDIREEEHLYYSAIDYDWANMKAYSEWRSGEKATKKKVMDINSESLDAISLFFRLRSEDSKSFTVGQERTLNMVLPDTIRYLKYRFLGNDIKRVRRFGKFKALKFACELGSSEEFSFTDGTEFTVWISDDKNKIPLHIESAVRVGKVCAYIYDMEGLKYPLDSRIE